MIVAALKLHTQNTFYPYLITGIELAKNDEKEFLSKNVPDTFDLKRTLKILESLTEPRVKVLSFLNGYNSTHDLICLFTEPNKIYTIIVNQMKQLDTTMCEPKIETIQTLLNGIIEILTTDKKVSGTALSNITRQDKRQCIALAKLFNDFIQSYEDTITIDLKDQEHFIEDINKLEDSFKIAM